MDNIMFTKEHLCKFIKKEPLFKDDKCDLSCPYLTLGELDKEWNQDAYCSRFEPTEILREMRYGKYQRTPTCIDISENI